MRRVLMVAYDDVQTLDVTGPAEVFAIANTHKTAAYSIEFTMVGGGVFRTTSGMSVNTQDLLQLSPQAEDTVVVAGASEAGTLQAMRNTQLLRWLQTAHGRVERIASVCTGSFVLAGAGLLEGKRATTHWLGCDRFAQMFPRVNLDRDAIFVRDGATWTSAGVLTGIDMALAIVEADLGSAVADAVAAHLVLYARRPGSQSQFSEAMVAQLDNSNPLGAVLAWVRAHLDRADVEVFAKRAGVSVRTLHRRCLIEFDCTPAKLLNKLRVEHACSLLATSDLSAKALTAQCGFGSCEHLRRVFQQVMGMSPEHYRKLHAR